MKQQEGDDGQRLGEKRPRDLIAGIYAPWTAVGLGLGILTVALPLYLLEIGLSFTATSVVLAAAGFGAFAAALPTGSLVAQHGWWPILAVSLVVATAGVALTTSTENAVLLTSLQLAVGAAATAMRLASLTEITQSIPSRLRGRANSNMGGLRRLGAFIGPLVGGVLIDRFGYTATFLVAAAVTAVGLIPLMSVASDRHVGHHQIGAARHGVLQALLSHGRLLARATSGPFLIMTARRGRSILLPLIAAALGVSATTVGVIVAIGTGADLLLFPVAGWIMDRFGRLWAVAPSFSLMAAGLFLLSTVSSTMGVILAGALIGIGNGMSAGTMMTLAGDLAPRDSPSQFIAGFSAVQDAGAMIGPLVVGVIADQIGLDASAFVLGCVLLVGVALIIATVGETSTNEPVFEAS